MCFFFVSWFWSCFEIDTFFGVESKVVQRCLCSFDLLIRSRLFPRKVPYFPWRWDSSVLIDFYNSGRTESPKERVLKITLLRKGPSMGDRGYFWWAPADNGYFCQSQKPVVVKLLKHGNAFNCEKRHQRFKIGVYLSLCPSICAHCSQWKETVKGPSFPDSRLPRSFLLIGW